MQTYDCEVQWSKKNGAEQLLVQSPTTGRCLFFYGKTLRALKVTNAVLLDRCREAMERAEGPGLVPPSTTVTFTAHELRQLWTAYHSA